MFITFRSVQPSSHHKMVTKKGLTFHIKRILEHMKGLL